MEAKEAALECRPGGYEGTGGRKLPLSLNPLEMTMRRRMKMRKRGDNSDDSLFPLSAP
jgi:hypothetical protein